MNECEGKIALVTGASRGIGRSIARRLAAEGAAVAVSASVLGKREGYAESLEQTVVEIESAGGRAAAIAANLADEHERANLVARAEEALGPIDILVNNAAYSSWESASTCTLKARRRMFEVNYHAPVDLIQQALPGMRERGHGWILGISSATAEQPKIPYTAPRELVDTLVIYGCTKASLDRYHLGLAAELSGEEIFVNCLAPTAIVLTQDAVAFVGDVARSHPEQVESVETVAEAALVLVSGRHTGHVVLSRDLLHATQRPVHSLDGTTVIADAFSLVEPDATS